MSEDHDDDSYEHRQAYPSAEYLIHRRYQELGGSSPVLERLNAAGGKLLSDQITAGHRALVHDLVAANLTHREISLIIGCSLERLQTLFEEELVTGAPMAKASVASALYAKAIAGNVTAQKEWLSRNPVVQWVTRDKSGDLNVSIEVTNEQKRATDIVESLAKSIETDPTVHRPAKALPARAKETTAKVKPKAYNQSIRKPREEN